MFFLNFYPHNEVWYHGESSGHLHLNRGCLLLPSVHRRALSFPCRWCICVSTLFCQQSNALTLLSRTVAGLESWETIIYTAMFMWSTSMIVLLQNGKILLIFLQSKALSQRHLKSYQQTNTVPKSERESRLILLSLWKQVSSSWNNNRKTIIQDRIYWGWITDLQKNTEKSISLPFSCSRHSSGSNKLCARKSEPPAGAERINRAV